MGDPLTHHSTFHILASVDPFNVWDYQIYKSIVKHSKWSENIGTYGRDYIWMINHDKTVDSLVLHSFHSVSPLDSCPQFLHDIAGSSIIGQIPLTKKLQPQVVWSVWIREGWKAWIECAVTFFRHAYRCISLPCDMGGQERKQLWHHVNHFPSVSESYCSLTPHFHTFANVRFNMLKHDTVHRADSKFSTSQVPVKTRLQNWFSFSWKKLVQQANTNIGMLGKTIKNIQKPILD